MAGFSGRERGYGWIGIWLLLAGCVSVPHSARSLSVEDVPGRNVLRVSNRSNRDIAPYYNHGRSFGDLQMFYVRFRDREGNIFDLGGMREGWFTPKLYSGT